ncbi:MAG: hypothetical protein R2788_09210 [Saprospiraceae bacterium]
MCFWADYVVKNLKNAGREDIQRIVRIYKVIANYELGEIDQMEADIRSTNRYYQLIGLSKDRFENVLLNTYLKRVFSAPISELKEVKTQFQEFLIKIKNQPNGDIPLGVDELMIWNEK